MDAAEREALADLLEGDLKPYKERFARYQRLPARGRPRQDILAEMEEVHRLEQPALAREPHVERLAPAEEAQMP